MKHLVGLCMLAYMTMPAAAQNIKNNPNSNHGNAFEQLGTILPTPNEQRTASGAPGNRYWQQRADYTIIAELDEAKLQLNGKEKVTYFNNSPDVLTYIWLQLDENEHDPNTGSVVANSSRLRARSSEAELNGMDKRPALEGHGVKIDELTDQLGTRLKYTINQTMMRIEMPVPLKPGMQFVFNLAWHYRIPDRSTLGGRGGLEYFPEDGNHVFTMTQWFPRLCVYSDFQGWQNHQFDGQGEFALVFGNYDVKLTVPADHLVGATGECQNYTAVLSAPQLKRWQQAQTATDVVEIGLLADAKAAEAKKQTGKKTWNFKANMVRDFAWTSSRKFIWDAMPVQQAGKKVMCMSFYPKEAYNLWRRYSTKAIAHTIKWYSHFTINYPYPVAQSIEANNGMEYPMICFNNGRCAPDGSYTEATKYGMIGVIIHEVGHNFFPMIVNSDERQWSWMDEGLNTFTQYLAQELWDNKYPNRRGPAYTIVDYMKMPKNQLEPIMTNSENIVQFGPNAYSKPATGLNILRETIMGRELFDYAFKEYARRWAFKHPTPADFFRTMEDASAVDLDWFWRGWFYGIDPVDIAIDSVRVFRLDGGSDAPVAIRTDTIKIPAPVLNDFDDISKIRNREDKNIVFATDADTSLRDFYYYYARGQRRVDTTPVVRPAAGAEPASTEAMEKYKNQWIYEVHLNNKGGMVMPLILEWTFEDGSTEIDRIPAQVWRTNEQQLVKSFIKAKKVTALRQDPMRETADIDTSNNLWPTGALPAPSKFQLYKGGFRNRSAEAAAPNPMQRAQR
jgi:hypothetical protein